MEAEFSTRTEGTVDGAWIVAVAGEVDLYTAPELKRQLLDAVRAGGNVIVDLSRTTFIDSTALTVLVDAARRLRASGGRVALVCTDRNIVKVFHITALDRLFPIFRSREDALRALAAPAPDPGPAGE